MYRQTLINKQDQNLQKIVWRENSRQPLKTYKLATITYGTKAAPFLAMMTLRKLATDEQNNFPIASKVLTSSFFVDDLVHGSGTIEQGKQLISELRLLLQKGGMNLRKWSSNNSDLLSDLQKGDNKDENKVFNFKTGDTSKTLGLCWNSSSDQFTFNYQVVTQNIKPTKRCLLSDISKLFDPLGWLAPLSTKLKLLFQSLWKLNLKWDDTVPDDIYKEWSKLKADIHLINSFEIPRWLLCSATDVIQLHGFCDASEKAYACVVYARIHNNLKSIIVAAKSKLVPHKKALSLPKLELSGALLLSKLIDKIKTALNQHQIEFYCWTDSMAVLGWIQGEPNRWKPFVANRVEKITKIIPSNDWRYVRSNENPADAASRGLYASQIKDNLLWWDGPSWLPLHAKEHLEQRKYDTNLESRKNINQSNIIQTENRDNIINNILNNYSSITKCIRIVAWLQRALNPQRKQLPQYITLQELEKAKLTIIKYVQENEFTEVIEQLRNHTTVKLKSNLLNLNPFIDGNNILRVGGRLRHGDLSLNTKHPMIVPANNRLACLLIEQAHLQTFHGGPSLTLAHLRKEYWITGGLRIIKKHLRNCVTCKRNRPLKQQQLMGDLPEARVNPAPPFYHTGVDYTGFMDVKLNKGRGAKTTKGYVAVFICMVTKAVHLEIVSDLTSSAFMAALRRMAARRGTPAHIYSDNGTNFHGANNIMKQEYQQILKTFNNSFLSEVAEMGIKWHFNAPSWPSAGGIWERAVRSLKHHLKRVVGEQKLTFEEFATILSQVETCLNSRPLCALTEDTENLHVLTPAHFLTGRPGGAIIETADDARSRWNLTNRIFQEMWNKWKSEYLTQLQARRKWMSPQQNIKLNDIVIIHEDNLPAGKWAIGRVIETHPGADGYVRVVTLQTQNGRIKRPVVKLSLLPITEKTDLNTNTDTEQPDQQRLKRQRVNRNCKKGTTLSTIVMGLLYFFTLLTNILGATVITELRQNQTLYFDHKAKLQLSRDQWTLVVYYDMSPYWEGNTAFDKMYQYLETSCNPANGNDQCNIIMQHLNHQFLEIKYYNQLLLNQLFHGHSRQRRGLLNGVGYLANSLFGVLDERFAEQYSTDINKIKQDQKHLYSLWKNQTSLVESEYNLLKRTESIISKHHKSINKQFNIIEKAVTDVEKQVSGQAQSINFALSAITAQSMLQTLKDIQETLLDTTTDLYQGHFNLHLLRPEQLKNELNTISGLLAADITLPIQNIQSDMRELYKLLRVRARMTENYFIFEIKIPLISRDTYDLYQVIPIPQRTENYTINIVPISNLIAINLQKDSFIPVSQKDFTNCLHKDILNIICILQSPVYKMKNDLDLCMKNEEKINECKINKVPCQNNWYSLSKANTYLYLCCAQCQIRTICKDLITAYQLSSPSLINADSNCIIKTNNFTVFTHQSQISTLNIEEKVETSFIAPINHIINISLEHYTTESIKINDKLSSQIEQKIKSLKEAELSTESNDLSFHDIHHYSLSYGIIGVIVLVGIVWSCRRVRRRRSRREAPAAATEPENAAQPAARASRSISMCQVNDISECDSARVRKFNSETELKVLKAEFVPKKLVFSED